MRESLLKTIVPVCASANVGARAGGRACARVCMRAARPGVCGRARGGVPARMTARLLLALTGVVGSLLLALPAVPVADAQEGPPPATPTVSATVEQCLVASVASGRSVTFTGQMETIPGADRMAMQIVVQVHLPGDTDFHTLTAAGPAAWERSEPGVKIYKYVRQVTDLPAPAVFRAVVKYRWLSEDGRVIRTEKRHTAACREDRSRANLPTPPTPGTSSGGSSGTSPAGGSSTTPNGGSTTPGTASGTATSGSGTATGESA